MLLFPLLLLLQRAGGKGGSDARKGGWREGREGGREGGRER